MATGRLATQPGVRLPESTGRARPLGLSAPQVNSISAIYLLDALVRLLSEGYGQEQDVISWHREVLEKFAPAIATTATEASVV